MSDKNFDDVADSYEEELDRGISLSGETKDYFARMRVMKVAELLCDGLPVNAVMDFGCGTGGAVPHLYRHLGPQRIVGVDVSRKSIDVARARAGNLPADFLLMGEYDRPASVDLVFCNGVFHHIAPADRAEALAYVHRQLKPGARFAFWENNPWNPGTQWIMRRIPFDRDAVRISMPQARTLLKSSGFQITHSESMFLFPRALSLLRFMEKWMLKLPIGAQYLVLAQKTGAAS